ncbi:hypothetical protein DXT77_12280 [Pseudomonas sp. 91RF]|jgi:hypothetical protein|uniref:hypothetical protein n=1 Tax=Pseudomonas sp. 91RF TaxID=2292261 RepID=UPI000E66E8E9|nr:hypothetical protein [Pseudomonas sp. 91RF]RIJ10539.1 hypothetical protein DXT77_12280 [Pseudomonas sp. 91RF]
MLKNNRKITNPISVIAIFAFISETSAAVSLPFLDNDEREIYIWFLISFPFYLLFLFFITLNFNYRSLYAPSDFDNDKNFLKAFKDKPPDFLDESTVQSHTGSHTVKLPKPLNTLCIIDIRGMNTEAKIDTLLKKIPHPGKHSTRISLVLTDDMSEILPKENLAKILKQGRKAMGTTYCIIYDIHSLNITVLGKV